MIFESITILIVNAFRHHLTAFTAQAQLICEATIHKNVLRSLLLGEHKDARGEIGGRPEAWAAHWILL